MSAIKHTDLFDFPAYQAAIKETEAQTKAFGAEVSSVLKRIKQDQKGLTDDLEKYATLLKNFSVAVSNAGSQLKKFSDGIDGTKQKMADSKAISTVLTSTLDAQAATVKELKEQYKLQKQALEALRPTDEQYETQQKQILDQVQKTVVGIKAYNDTLRKTKESVGVAEGSYRAMVQRLNELRNTLRNLPGAFDPVSGKLNKANKDAVSLSNEIKRLDTSVKQADASMGIFARNVGNYSGALKGFAASFLATVGIGSAFEGFRQIFDVNRNFDQLNSALKLVSVTSEQFGENQRFLTRIAQAYGLEIEALTKAFNKFFAASTNAGLSVTATNRIFDQVSKVAANLKLSQDEVNSVFLAFSQIASKGKVQAEELRGQLGERIPGAASIAARALGVTEQQLGKLLEQGKVVAEDFLPKFAAELEKTFGKEENIKTLNAEINRLFNVLKTGVQNENFTAFLSDTIRAITDFVEGVQRVAGEVSFFFEAIANSKGLISPGEFLNQRNSRDRAVIEEKAFFAQLESIKKDFNNKSLEEQSRIITGESRIMARSKKEFEIATKLYKDNAEVIRKYRIQAQKDERIFFELSQAFIANSKEKKPGAPADKKVKTAKGPSPEDLERRAVNEAQKFYKELADLELSQQELLLSEKRISEVEYQEEILRIKKSYIDAAIELEKSLGANADQTNLNKFVTEGRKAQTEFNKFINGQNEEANKAQKKFLEEGFKRTKDSLDKTGKEKKDSLDAQFEAEKDLLDKTFALAAKGRDRNFDDEIRYQQALIKLKKKYGRELTENEIAEERAREERRRRILQAAIDLGAEAANSVLQIVVDQNQAKFDAITASIEKKREEELAAAGNNAAAREAIEKKYNERLRQENIRKAKADKQAALFRIAISTAQAVAQAVAVSPATFGLPFSAFALATGALQAAVVAARPIPQFRKGTKSAPRGLAIVGEEGPELIERNGRYRLSPGKATLVKLAGGEKIHTAKETTRIIERASKQQSLAKSLASEAVQSTKAIEIIREKDALNTRALAEAMRINESAIAAAFNKAVAGIPITQNIVDERGQRKRQIKLNERKTSLNRL
jgi:tape measure domain-containing protein